LTVKLTERSTLVQVVASTQQLTSPAGLVRELAGRSWRASRPGDGEDARPRLLASAGDPRAVRDVGGHAGASTGAKRFLGECLRRVPAGARLFLRADEGFFGKDFLAELEGEQITYAVGVPLIASLRTRISEIAEAEWRLSCYRAGSEVVSSRSKRSSGSG
jgi:hypothetical protein